MNKRIRELAEQAGGYVSLSYEHDGKLILSGEDIVEKFAELIVRECLEVAHPKPRDVGEWSAGMRLVQTRIKDHFGVEE